MNNKRTQDNIIFESPSICTRSELKGYSGCCNSQSLKGCKNVKEMMHNHYIDNGIYVINGITYYSIRIYKIKIKEKLSKTLNNIAKKYLNGRQRTFMTYDFIFNSIIINDIDSKVLKEQLDSPYALSRRDMYKESDNPNDLREIFPLEILDDFYNSYFEWVFNNIELYSKGLEKYKELTNHNLMI